MREDEEGVGLALNHKHRNVCVGGLFAITRQSPSSRIAPTLPFPCKLTEERDQLILQDDQRNERLFSATKEDDEKKVRILLKAKADVNAKDEVCARERECM